ncbi:DsbA family protein [Marinobacter salicampi]|uniref:DsbA family protein n=1 Tax=Marinobacter salicampi TaxID=435907 RepID=UPI0014091C03|nr:DsbA family protein [Marinobacter salicampi]
MRKPEKADLMPWVARLIASPVTRRCRQEFFRLKALPKGQVDVAEVFINPRDPFSMVLLQALPDLTRRFEIQFRFHTIWRQPGEMFPEPRMWLEWAIEDAGRLAELYGLAGPTRAQPPTEAELTACRNQLLAAEQSADYLQQATDHLKALWHGRTEAPASTGEDSTLKLEQRLEHNEQRLVELGHYQGGMVHFRGEWFWGVDRLDHLEGLLIREGRARDATTVPLWDRTWARLGLDARALEASHLARDQALEVFFSIRSPYSYLGLERAVMLAKAWNIPLQLRPVLPMLMRGQSVPDTKKWYIFQDTKREARKLGLPYGSVADPLGAGVERCYALFDYARSIGREIDYMRSYAQAVNAEGIRSETDAGLRTIVERAGLDWQKAKRFLADQSWRDWAELNRKAMYENGLWGVPSFRYGKVSCWGQDRLWLVEEEIKKGAEVSSTQRASVQQQRRD